MSFEAQALKIKPLDMPFTCTTPLIRGHKANNKTLAWEVDFPAGFHDMLKVDIRRFSRHNWTDKDGGMGGLPQR